MILVEMIQCTKTGMTHVPVHPLSVPSDYRSDYLYSYCTWCHKPVFTDLAARASILNGPMAKFTDADGHLWIANQERYVIQEEPF